MLLLVLELNSASPSLLHALGGALLLGRLLHAFGLSSQTGTSPGRFLGTVITWTVILVECLVTLYGAFAA